MSQVRLYGSTFDDGSDEKQRMGPREMSPQEHWARYRENEAKCLGDFVLAYPTNEYPDQPTAGLQKLYDHILYAANSLISVSGGALTSFHMDEVLQMQAHALVAGGGSTRKSPSPQPPRSPQTAASRAAAPWAAWRAAAWLDRAAARAARAAEP